jgi:predicted dehydrogenase
MEIYGAEGTAWLRTLRGDLALYAPSYFGQEGWFAPTLPTPPLGLRHHRHFLAMVAGQEPPDTSAADGLATLLVCEAVYRSAESGAWEEVETP